MTGSRILVPLAALVLVVHAADPAWAVKCLDDAADAAQIAATRTAVDAACKCFGVASPAEYARCAAGVINDRATMSLLRTECRGTVRRIYTQSVCGREITRVTSPRGPRVPCVAETNATGRISCTLRPFLLCNPSFSQQRTRCLAHTHCLDAADTNGDLRIAAPGDSGECVPLADTFTDNGDGTITDGRTGLMWEKLSDDGSIHDWDDTYTWADASAVKVAALNSGGGFAGYTDWRFATIHELMTLVRDGTTPPVAPDFDTGCTPGCTVLTCSCTAASIYSSATEMRPVNASGIFLSGGGGSVVTINQGASFHVRAVRGGS